jgi:alpha-glucosidase (family GH31 glycosyl hydrolase)
LITVKYLGNQYQTIYGKIDEVPIFVPQGAIVPQRLSKLGKNATILNFNSSNSLADCDILEIHLFTGANRVFLMYDDDGNSMEYQTTSTNVTLLSQKFSGVYLILFCFF